MPSTGGRIAPGTARRATVLAVLVALAVAAALASLAVGARSSAGLDDVVRAVVRYDPAVDDQLVVRDLRGPRTVLALLVGGALGLAGGVMQGLTRNPLADPGLLGVNAGAALAVVLGFSVFGVVTPGGYLWFALGGAAVAGGVVFTLGTLGRGGASPAKLAIAGAAVSALPGSATASLLLIDAATLDLYRFWVVGSVATRDLTSAAAVAPVIAVGAVLALASARSLNGLALGDDVARSLGQHVGRARATAAAAVILLCGGATAAAGPIWFIGLTVPHVARAVAGPDHRWLLPFSALLGAGLLAAADVVGRVIGRPGELEVGVVAAFLGGPIFIAFVRRRRIAEL